MLLQSWGKRASEAKPRRGKVAQDLPFTLPTSPAGILFWLTVGLASYCELASYASEGELACFKGSLWVDAWVKVGVLYDTGVYGDKEEELVAPQAVSSKHAGVEAGGFSNGFDSVAKL